MGNEAGTAPSVLGAQPNREAGSGLMRAPDSVAGPRSGHEAQRDLLRLMNTKDKSSLVFILDDTKNNSSEI